MSKTGVPSGPGEFLGEGGDVCRVMEGRTCLKLE